MKKLNILFSFLLISFLTLPAAAQHMAHHTQQDSAMRSGTTGGMMGNHNMMSGDMMHGHGSMHRGHMDNMAPGMHNNHMNMMNSYPMMKSSLMLINRLPRMQKALSLTDNQTDKLQQMQNDFNKGRIDLNASLEKNEIDLNTVIDNDAPVSDFRSALKKIEDIKINMAIQAYETVIKMKNVLSAAQKEELKSNISGNMMGSGMGSKSMMKH